MVVERLARRCGFDEVAQAMPPSDSKLLTHIRKQDNRKQRRKAGSNAGGEGWQGVNVWLRDEGRWMSFMSRKSSSSTTCNGVRRAATQVGRGGKGEMCG